jgi:TRAP transporter TAXI family solute receptor
MSWTGALTFAVAAALFAAPACAQTVSIVTSPTGSYTNSAGAAMAKVISEKTKVRAVVQAQAQQGMILVEDGSAEFGMGNAFDATFFVTGTGEYEGQGAKKNLRQVAALVPFRNGFHVRADSDIRRIADLKGKRVSSGFNAQKTIARLTEAMLANGGLSYKDVVQVLTPNVSRSAEDFADGKVDVLYFALGSALVKQAAATVGGVRVLPIDASPEAMARAEAIIPGAYVVAVNPSANLDGITAPTQVMAVDMILFAHASVPDQLVYAVCKALHENKAALAATFNAFNIFEPNSMAKPIKDVPFHPGAVNYYQELGLLSKT